MECRDEPERMKPDTRWMVRAVLLCAALGCVAARFWFRRHGQIEMGDVFTLLSVVLMAASGLLRPGKDDPA